MHRVQVHCDPVWLQDPDQLIGDLDPDPLLDREAPGEDSHQPGQFGDADDLLMSDVADVSVPVERERVMLAQREEFDGPRSSAECCSPGRRGIRSENP